MNLNDNEIGDEGCLIVSEIVKVNKNIMTLGLRNNNVSSVGAVFIAEMLWEVEEMITNGYKMLGCEEVCPTIPEFSSNNALSVKATFFRGIQFSIELVPPPIPSSQFVNVPLCSTSPIHPKSTPNTARCSSCPHISSSSRFSYSSGGSDREGRGRSKDVWSASVQRQALSSYSPHGYGKKESVVSEFITPCFVFVLFYWTCRSLDSDRTLSSKRMRRPGVGRCPVNPFLVAYEWTRSCALIDINLSGNCIRSEGIFLLSASLSHNSALTSLDVSENEVDWRAGVYLGWMLGGMHVNEMCDSEGERRMSMGMGMGGMGIFRPNSSVLQNLDIEKNSLGDEGCEQLCLGLRLNRSLVHLIMTNIGITQKGLDSVYFLWKEEWCYCLSCSIIFKQEYWK